MSKVIQFSEGDSQVTVKGEIMHYYNIIYYYEIEKCPYYNSALSGYWGFLICTLF